MLPMQLFVLPPAFGLPSIDAECNAAVALLQRRVNGGYEVTARNHQVHQLPFLIDGASQISGFQNIVKHFANKRVYDEKTTLHAQQRADSTAITAFIQANAPILLDINLYVSFENYRHTTRPAYTKVLPWHLNYILPPQRRAVARTRTEHLGISSIDVDNVHEDMSNRPAGFEGVGKEQAFEAEAQKRASLLLPRKETVRSLLQRPQHAAMFRLHALADSFFGPLSDMLKEGQYMLQTEEAQAVDCLLYGYLSLMLFPQVPQDWLASTIRHKYQRLAKYVERLHEELRLSTEVDAVLALVRTSSRKELAQHRQAAGIALPWTVPALSTTSNVLAAIANGILDQLPLVGPKTKLQILQAKSFSLLERHLPTFLLSFVASGAALVYVSLRTGVLVWPHGQEMQIFGKRRLTDYGHLGAALAGINLLGPRTQSS